RPGPYRIQAGVNAVHSDASAADETDWRQIVHLYDQLLAVGPTPVVALYRAVAVAEVDGPAAGLALVDRPDLDRYHVFHAVRADLLRRLGRTDEAVWRRTTRHANGPPTRPSAGSSPRDATRWCARAAAAHSAAEFPEVWWVP
ncbi:MAG TPA: hypothetical protein VI076_05790, partial [Actinopolymorphaceae bacterium]